MILSPLVSTFDAIVNAICFAALRLTTNSKLVDCSSSCGLIELGLPQLNFSPIFVVLRRKLAAGKEANQ
jgi:hypothetical protein